MPRHPNSHGARTRGAIVRAAADLASVEGLDGLSIGRLASELAMSKSGLFAHFGSKEDLQLAAIEEARQRYVQEVVAPGLAAGSGITRLYALCEAFLSYIEREVFPGGCFFASAMAEFDCKAPGPVRDRIAECQHEWMNTLERAAHDARTQGQLGAGSDPQQLAFELEGALLTANWYFHLYADPGYLGRGAPRRPGSPCQRSYSHWQARPWSRCMSGCVVVRLSSQSRTSGSSSGSCSQRVWMLTFGQITATSGSDLATTRSWLPCEH